MGSARKQKKEVAAVYRQWTPEQKFLIIMEYYSGKLSVSDLCRKQCAVENEQPRVEVSIW